MPARKSGQLNFNYTPLCDELVVQSLLEQRNAIRSAMESGMMDEDIILTYIDLDRLLERTKLSAKERQTVNMVMEGYSMVDISQVCGGQRQAYAVFYRRAIRKICETCNDLWEEFYGDRPAKGICY